MADRIKINYAEADRIVNELNKGLNDMTTNVETLTSKTNAVIGIEWIGKDADATKRTMEDMNKTFNEQIEALRTIKNNIKTYIEEALQHEEEAARAQGGY